MKWRERSQAAVGLSKSTCDKAPKSCIEFYQLNVSLRYNAHYLNIICLDAFSYRFAMNSTITRIQKLPTSLSNSQIALHPPDVHSDKRVLDISTWINERSVDLRQNPSHQSVHCPSSWTSITVNDIFCSHSGSFRLPSNVLTLYILEGFLSISQRVCPG